MRDSEVMQYARLFLSSRVERCSNNDSSNQERGKVESQPPVAPLC